MSQKSLLHSSTFLDQNWFLLQITLSKDARKQSTEARVSEQHSNLCGASESSGLGHVLHFSPTRVRHHSDVMEMPVNKVVLTGQDPSGGLSSVRTKQYKISAVRETLVSGFTKKKTKKPPNHQQKLLFTFLFYLKKAMR